MLAAIHANADPRSVRQRRDHVDFNAWWRGGDGPSVRIYPSRATWRDIITGESGGAKDFAATAFGGMSLRDFMQRWGDPSARPAPRPAPVQLPNIWENNAAAHVWHRHEVQGSPFLDRWCVVRGWPITEIGSLCSPFRADAGWPTGVCRDDGTTLPQWLKEKMTAGRAILMPLRSARDGGVASLVLRWPNPPPGALKSMTLPGCKLLDNDGTPRGYGDASGVWREARTFLFEGGPDTVAGDIVLGRGVVSAGAVSAGELPKWARVLAHKGPVVVVPHLDKDSSKRPGEGFAGQKASAELVEAVRAAGREAHLFPWRMFLHRLTFEGVKCDGVGDFSDAVKCMTTAGWSGQRMATAVLQTVGWQS